MISFPFDSINIGNEDEPIWDRSISAQDERDFKKMCYTNGVFADRADGLLVSYDSGLDIVVGTGGCMINGAVGINKKEIKLTLDEGENVTRTDIIVARYDDSTSKRNIDVYIKKGEPGKPKLTKSNNIFEIQLAEITVPVGAKSIKSSNITDTRLDDNVCGMVLPAIPSAKSTQELWKQIKDSIDIVNGAINETVAGKINNEIETLKSEHPRWDVLSDSIQGTYGHLFSADYDGMALINVTPSDSNGWVLVRDTTSGTEVWRHNGYVGSGYSFTEWFPIFKNHKYELAGKNAGNVLLRTLYFKQLGN